MFVFVFVLGGWSGCAASPEERPAPEPESESPLPTERKLVQVPMDGPKLPLTAQVALLKIGHYRYSGHELFIDGKNRGTLPLDTTLTFGPHTFEILVGPGDKLKIERVIERAPGYRLLDLASEPEEP